MNHYHWDKNFLDLFDRCLQRYRSGDDDFEGYYSEEDRHFLQSIGYRPRELFDFVEDFGDSGDPSPATALLVASARRDYLRWEMNGSLSEPRLTPAMLPNRDEELEGFVWLPRILMKARGKLRGELDPDIMYCCGGDRNFLSRNNIAPGDFLRAVWSAGNDDKKVAEYVRSHSQS